MKSLSERHVTEIPEVCTEALVVAVRPTDDSNKVQILKWQVLGEPNCCNQLALLFGGVFSILQELEAGGHQKQVQRIEGLIAAHSVEELVAIFRA